MKTYEIYYLVNNKEYYTPYDAESLEDALLDANINQKIAKGLQYQKKKHYKQKKINIKTIILTTKRRLSR